MSITKLITCDNELVGYVSLLTDSIPLKDIRDDNLKKDIKKQLNIIIKRKNYLQLK
ncbi:MAG: hypothetical protein IJ672_05285 [Methanobrevibacter sp.]|uniref:hypothetical protein n=1 Tax=Methanobrevibacter sp. TaxID=66852 RepID=UPI0025F6C983|nr:hypothetical protein [Methanobrevibacter sp.]MBQ8017749.1 hypothetical protein [Methanobrevibacter sp.]MBR1610880.1 hypothetical protein [Methanobrevibacter sp.]